MAASSYSKPVIGQVAKILKVIPVHRPEDHKKKSAGKVSFESEKEIKVNFTLTKLIFQVIDINLLEEIKRLNINQSGLCIAILNYTFVIDKILEEGNKILIKENPDAIKLLELKDKTFEFFYIPKVDNSFLFKDAYQRLSENGAICIFPEGTSHDRTNFLKLKAGIALMSLGAMAEGKTKNIKILPVGLNYFKREEFRSIVNIEFGKAFEIPSEWAELYKTNKRAATEKLLIEIEFVKF